MGERNDTGVTSAHLLGAMWWYAAQVLVPAQSLKRAGLRLFDGFIGDKLLPLPVPGLGPRFSAEQLRPVYLKHATGHDHLVEEFDRIAEVYVEFVEPYSRPIFDEAIALLRPLIPSDARLLDAGCGPGRELVRIARLVVQGEIVGVDLAAGMVTSAWRAARAAGLDRCAFFQADVTDLPHEFDGAFDLAYSCLAHHHYPNPAAAASSVLRALRPGGLYCVVDPGPAWFNRMSHPIAAAGDPGFVGFHTPEEFRELFAKSGFARTCWFELLPGFGLAVGQKAAAAAAPPVNGNHSRRGKKPRAQR